MLRPLIGWGGRRGAREEPPPWLAQRGPLSGAALAPHLLNGSISARHAPGYPSRGTGRSRPTGSIVGTTFESRSKP